MHVCIPQPYSFSYNARPFSRCAKSFSRGRHIHEVLGPKRALHLRALSRNSTKGPIGGGFRISGFPSRLAIFTARLYQ